MEKTLQELYDEVVKDEKLIKEFTEAEKEGKLEEFLKAHGCNATEEELQKFLASEITDEKELSPEELDKVAGGKSNNKPSGEIVKMARFKCDKCGAELMFPPDYASNVEGKKHIDVNRSCCDGILHRV